MAFCSLKNFVVTLLFNHLLIIEFFERKKSWCKKYMLNSKKSFSTLRFVILLFLMSCHLMGNEDYWKINYKYHW